MCLQLDNYDIYILLLFFQKLCAKITPSTKLLKRGVYYKNENISD